jgi:hypothetical protein
VDLRGGDGSDAARRRRLLCEGGRRQRLLVTVESREGGGIGCGETNPKEGFGFLTARRDLKSTSTQPPAPSPRRLVLELSG